MARKGGQQKNGIDRNVPSTKKKSSSNSRNGKQDIKGQGKASEAKKFPGEELLDGEHVSSSSEDAANEIRKKKNAGSILRNEKQGVEEINGPEQPVPSPEDSENCNGNAEAATESKETETSSGGGNGQIHFSSLSCLLNFLCIKNVIEKLELSDNVVVRSLNLAALSIMKAAGELLDQQRPSFNQVSTKLRSFCDQVGEKIRLAYPIVMKLVICFFNIVLILLMVWLDCALRGIDSFLRQGTTSFFVVIWCSILSLIAVVGMFKFLMVLVFVAFIGAVAGFSLAILLATVSVTAFLWLYGSFWTGVLVVFLGGLAFMTRHERVALLIATAYSIYCAWANVGWLGLVLNLNLSFISSDILVYLLKSSINENRRTNHFPEHTPGMQGRPGFTNYDAARASSSGAGPESSANRSSGVPSTSGEYSEVTSDDEVLRLLNCSDHYSVLGLSRYENVDASILKREYRKKAMLVHPDKNMGNEKAAEAFKKLQNAYEVLLDSLKRKAYDDELRREELLGIFRRFQGSSQKSQGHERNPSGYAHSETDTGDLFGESRRTACKNCNSFHVWKLTRKSKSQARWCQDCKDYHQAKDGDGWVEQSSHPFLFGLLQKVDTPCAYVCADSKIYDATEWYICQGMRCPANTHKPSFHVNSNATSKHNTGKGASSGQRGGRMPSGMEEGMTEDEFFEWLQNAVQAGVFDNFGGSTSAESPSAAKSGNANKSTGGSSGSSSKRKKKGKKQW